MEKKYFNRKMVMLISLFFSSMFAVLGAVPDQVLVAGITGAYTDANGLYTKQSIRSAVGVGNEISQINYNSSYDRYYWQRTSGANTYYIYLLQYTSSPAYYWNIDINNFNDASGLFFSTISTGDVYGGYRVDNSVIIPQSPDLVFGWVGTNQGFLGEGLVTITIPIVNSAPTNIAISASMISENVAANSVVGIFSSTDPDAGNTFTYTLISGSGSTDNASFNISGSNLQITHSPDYEVKNSYTVRIRTTDQGGVLFFEKAFTITINDVNEVPSTSNAGADQIKCNNSSFTLEGNNPSVGSGEWSLVSGTASITSASSYNSAATVAAGISATLRWTISNSPYTPSTDDVVLTNKTATAITSQSTAAQTQCLNGSFSAITLTTTGSNLSYQWYSNAEQIASGGLAVGTSANTYTPSAATAGTLYYYCVVTGDCGTETSTISGAFVVRAAFTAGEISSTTQTICTVGTPTEISSTMDASGGNGSVTYRWQSSTDAGFSSPTDISSNTVTYTPISGLAVTTWYRRQAKDGVCNTNWSNSANVTQIAVNTTSFTPAVRYVSDLTATGQNIKWYAAASGGSALASTIILPNGTTHYYASQTVNSVESTARFDVTVTVDPTPCAPGGTASQNHSSGETVASLVATGGTGSTIRWYAAATGGAALATSTALVNGTHYYATQTINCTESATRLGVTVIILPAIGDAY